VSEKVSLVIEDLRKFETKDVKINRQASINKGLNTFCYCSQANILATGGKDKYIRLYNPLILSKTIGKLPGHLFTIVDLACNEKDQQLISLSAERVFRVWDLSTFKCLQIFSDTENRPGEKRIFCIYFDQKRERLLTCSSALDCWPVASSVNDTTQVPHSHDKPLVSICYSHNQIATISSDSNLKVWDTVTGRLVYSVKECHGRYSTSNPTDRKTIEVTCMTRDVTGYKLITGAINGSIKIWDFGSGSNLKSKQDITSNDNDLKIISINYLKIKDQLLLFACGWGNKIKIFYVISYYN
jgi:WD40 repeat protein